MIYLHSPQHSKVYPFLISVTQVLYLAGMAFYWCNFSRYENS